MLVQERLTPWCARLLRVAPGVRLSLVMRIFGDTEARLVEGTLDFGLGLFSSLPPVLRRRVLWSDHYVCVVRKGHPLLKAPWTPEAFHQAPQVRVLPSGERFNLADARSAAGDLDGAIADYSAVLAEVPAHAASLFYRGRIRLRQDDAEGALKDFDAALTIDPGYFDIYVSRGALRARRGDRAGALADFRHFLKNAPPSWPGYRAVEAEVRRLVPYPERRREEELVASLREAGFDQDSSEEIARLYYQVAVRRFAPSQRDGWVGALGEVTDREPDNTGERGPEPRRVLAVLELHRALLARRIAGEPDSAPAESAAAAGRAPDP